MEVPRRQLHPRAPVGRDRQDATETVARAPPDGHTLLMLVPEKVVNAAMADRLPTFRKFVGKEIEKWGKVIQAANVRPD